jgi:hypothetical protein
MDPGTPADRIGEGAGGVIEKPKSWLDPVPPSLHRTYRWSGAIMLACFACNIITGIYLLVCVAFGFNIHPAVMYVILISLGTSRATRRFAVGRIRREKAQIADSQDEADRG